MVNDEKLSRMISRGKWHYIFIQGVLGWGVGAAILFSLFQHLFGGPSFSEMIWRSLVIFSIGGIFFGVFMWSFLKKRHEKNQKYK